MKNLLFVFALMIMSVCGYSQTVVYNFDTKPKSSNLLTEAQMIGKATKSADVAIVKGVKYPIYIGPKGGRFILLPKAGGGFTKKYIPKS